MKKRNLLYIALMVLCLVVLFGYRTVSWLSADTAAPEISIDEQLLQVSVQDPESALFQGMTAKDRRDGDVSASLVVESRKLKNSSGLLDVTYAAVDRAGNVAKAKREVQLTDYESPRFTLNGSLTFTYGTTFDIMNIIGAEDMVDGEISHRVRATVLDNVAVSSLGTHDVQCRVTNSLGDTVELVLPVEVYPAGSFFAELTLTDYLIYLDVGDAFQAEEYLNMYTMGRNSVSLRDGVPSDMSLVTTGEVNTQIPGVYAVTYRVSSIQSEQTSAGYAKLIVVVEG